MENEIKLDSYEEELDVSENDLKAKCLDKYTGKKLTNPVKAIKAKCHDCCGFQWNEVKQCTVYHCTLYPFRFGKNPYRTPRVMSEEEKARRTEILKKTRAKKSIPQIESEN